MPVSWVGNVVCRSVAAKWKSGNHIFLPLPAPCIFPFARQMLLSAHYRVDEGGECADLLGAINSLRNELAKRQSDLIANKLKLPATGRMSIAGHVQQFQNEQEALRKKLKDYDSQNCPGGGGTGDAWKLATQDPPMPELGPSSNASNSSVLMMGGGILLIGAGIVLMPEITIPALVFGAATGN